MLDMTQEIQESVLLGDTAETENSDSSRFEIQAILENIVSPITAIKVFRSCTLEEECTLDQADKFFNSPSWKIAYIFAIKAVKIIKALSYYDEIRDLTLAEVQERIERESANLS
jgi:hypothetical protein